MLTNSPKQAAIYRETRLRIIQANIEEFPEIPAAIAGPKNNPVPRIDVTDKASNTPNPRLLFSSAMMVLFVIEVYKIIGNQLII